MKYLGLILALLVVVLSTVSLASHSDFAVEVVQSQGNFSDSGLYKDPEAILGKPTLRCRTGTSPEPNYGVKFVQPAFNRSDLGEKVVTTIEPEEYIVVKFDHRVVDFPGNPFGMDFLVFGNSYFLTSSTDYVDDDKNINLLQLTNPAYVFSEEVWVSVSQDGQTWYSYENGPWADDAFPTQAYQWDRANGQWTEDEMDFTKPVDPNLSLSAFNGISIADAINLYDGSGGGTGYDLKELPDYDLLAVDPNSGYRWIQYVRLEGGQGAFALGGEVDAVSDVTACGDPTYPYPVGDISHDCRVDLLDLAILSENWMQCTYKCN